MRACVSVWLIIIYSWCNINTHTYTYEDNHKMQSYNDTGTARRAKVHCVSGAEPDQIQMQPYTGM